jgi:integrase
MDCKRVRALQHMSEQPATLRRAPSRPLTTAAIAALKPGQLLSDGGVAPGHGRLKIRKRASASGPVAEWIFIYWGGAAGKRVTMLLNGFASRYSPKEQAGFLTIAQARERARKLRADLQAGIDPAIQRQLDRAAAQKAQIDLLERVNEAKTKSLKALMDAYVASLKARSKLESAYDVENLVRNHIVGAFPALAELPAAEITARHVATILARLVGPDAAVKKGRTALKLRSYLSAAFRLSLGAELDPMAPASAAGFGLAVNPAAAVPATKMAAHFQRSGERTLSQQELRHYLVRLESVASPLHRLALELQVLSGGQRFQQLLRLTRADVGDDTFTLYDPKGKRAQPRAHVLPLLPELRERIEKLTAMNPVSDTNPRGHLFASTGGSVINPETLSGVVAAISRAMMESGEAATSFRGGDIRRTCETMMAGTLGISKETRAQLLSHGISGVQDVVYDKSNHLPAKIAALRAWIAHLTAIRAGTQGSSNVVPLKAA